jgi:tetratricopeptide (TPR) repeat protein
MTLWQCTSHFFIFEIASNNDYGNTYMLEMPNGTFSENVNISNKLNLTFNGGGSTTTTINGTVSISNCEGCNFINFKAQALSLSGCVNPNLGNINLDIGSVNPSLYAYNCTNFHYTGGNVSDRLAYSNGTGFNLYQSSTSTIDGSAYTLFYHNVRGIYANSSTVNIDHVHFCNNTYDLATSAGAHIYANYCSFPGGVAHTQGSGIYLSYNQISDCTGLSKSSGSLAKSTVNGPDTISDEFMQIDSSNFNIAKKVRADLSEKKEFNKDKYRNEYLSTINDYKRFINKHPGSEYSKTSLISVVHIYKMLGDYEGMKAFLQEIIADKNLTNESGWGKRFMLEYYSHNKDFTTALATAEEIMKERANNEDLLCDVLFAEGLIYLHDLNKTEAAIGCFSDIIIKYPDNDIAAFAENELKFLGVVKKQKDIETSETNIPGFSTGSYPSPFNPVTTIEYTLPIDVKVVIKIYDIIGREITTLVNEEKTAGRYFVKFNASNLSSGVYFYSINAGNFYQVKKLILAK